MTLSTAALVQTSPTDMGLSVAAEIALVTLGVLAAVAVVTLVMLLWQIRQVGRGLQGVAKSLDTKSGPVLEHARGVAANVEFISATVRTDVEHLNASVKALSERLTQASDHMEARIDEFNALLEVVQGEAEGIFIDAASTARGIRAGAKQLTLPEAEGETEADTEAEDLADLAPTHARDDDVP